mgnify:CR=1 FL=1
MEALYSGKGNPATLTPERLYSILFLSAEAAHFIKGGDMPTQKPQHLRDETIFPGEWGKGMIKRVFLDPRKGREEEYFLFHSEKVASIVLVLTKNKEVVAIRIFCQAANDFILQVPGGVPKAGESFEDTARREVLEETGYQVGGLIALGKGWFEPFNTTTHFNAFLALECEKVGEPRTDGTEYLEVEIYPFHEWWNMCLNGIIEDAKSVLLTMRAQGYMTGWA